MLRLIHLLTLASLLVGAHQITAHAQDVPDSIGYQGKLTTPSGQPVADGTYSVVFKIYNVPDGPNAPLWTSSAQNVTTQGGVFSASISGFPVGIFSDAFVWLETVVDGNTLSPRVKFESVPYAIRAGGGWSLTGNAGTTPGTNFLGTTDNQPLEVIVNNHRAVTYQYAVNTSTPGLEFRSINIVAGSDFNNIAPGVVGATISGGGKDSFSIPDEYNEIRVNSDFGTIGGGYNNIVAGSRAGTVGGGFQNTAFDLAATVAGGDTNAASGMWTTVAGGNLNSALDVDATVGGGAVNTASGIASTVPGGFINEAAGDYSFAAGRRAKANHHGTFVWGDSTDANFASTSDNQFLIRAGGGVGIGTPSPQAQFHVEGDVLSHGSARSQSPNATAEVFLGWGADSGGAEMARIRVGGGGPGATNGLDIQGPANVSLLRVHGNGNVGIGTTTPSMPLQIAKGEPVLILQDTGTATTQSGYLGFWNNNPSETAWVGFGTPGNTNFSVLNTRGNIILAPGATGNVGINTSGPTFKLHVNGSVAGVGAYNNVSDERVKRDIKPIADALDKVAKLHGVSFDWKRAQYPDIDFPRGRQIGVLGQEVARVLPECVTRDDKGYISVAYGSLVPVLLEAIKEQQQQIETMKADNKRLENKLEELESLKAEIARISEALRERPNSNSLLSTLR